MKTFGILFFVLTACSTPQVKKTQVDIRAYFQTDLTTSADLLKKFGKPSEVERDIIVGKSLEFWTYNDESRSYIEFLIDTADQTVLEKRYSAGEDEEISLDQLKAIHLQNVELQKVVVKCRHNDEIALVNKEAGIVILTKDNALPLKVQVIAQSNPQLYKYWLNENSNKKCSY